MQTQEIKVQGIRFAVQKDNKEAGHAYLYLLRNDLHGASFGLLEDLEVRKEYQSSGIGSELIRAVIERVKLEGCYKLLATSRNDGTRQSVHDWYVRLGFEAYGTEFRMNF